MSLPEPMAWPCRECPWRREAAPGWLGPHTAARWLGIAQSDEPVACHLTIRETDDEGRGDWEHPAMRQCAGVASFREHLCKLPRDPEVAVGPAREGVFARGKEFIEHHHGREMSDEEARDLVLQEGAP